MSLDSMRTGARGTAICALLATASIMPGSATIARPAAPMAAANPTCADILANGPTVVKIQDKEVKPADFCPAIETLQTTFKSADQNNHFRELEYSQPSTEFFNALAGSMKWYRRSPNPSILVRIGAAKPVTLASLDVGDDGNKFQRNQLGLIIERIRDGDRKGKRAGKLCIKYSEKSGVKPLDWAGTLILKYALPALIKLLAGDPLRNIDSYDAEILLDRSTGDVRTEAIRSITFVKRNSLPANCQQLKPIGAQ